MSPFITHTAKLTPYAKRPKSLPSFVTAYDYEPPVDESHTRHGRLFAVVEVLASGRLAEEVTDLVIESTGRHYYNDPTNFETPLARFEAAIKGVNGDLASYINDGNSAWIGKMSAILAVLVDDTLHVTQTGSAEAFLYRGHKGVHIVSATGGVHQTAKTFISIASGQLEIADRFLLTTPALIHHFAAEELTTIITASSPNGSIAKLHDRLVGVATADRVAALVVEVTTPELAALQSRDASPDEIHVGAPETILDAAKVAAAPIAAGVWRHSKKLTETTSQGVTQAKPHVRSLALGIIQIIRKFVTGTGSRQRLAISSGLVLLLIGAIIWERSQSTNLKSLTKRYFTATSSLDQARRAATSGDKDQARKSLEQLTKEVASLEQDPHHRALDRAVHKPAVATAVPASLGDLRKAIASEIDSLDNVVRLQPSVVSDLTSVKGSKPIRLELVGSKAIIVDSANSSAIYIIDLVTGNRRSTSAATKDLGKVVASGLNSTNDAVYLVTDTPSVWIYKPADDSLSKLSTGIVPWPRAKSLAAYTGNLYLLGDDIIYKHVPTLSGFSAKTDYLTSAQSPVIKGATAVAVDGNVYVAGPSGISRFLAGALQQTLVLPASLRASASLRGSASDGALCLVDPTSGRLGEVVFAGDTLSYHAQYVLSGTKSVTDGLCNSSTKLGYALADGKLVKFPLLPR